MQEYRRQIAYLYAYEHGIKARSAGFVKMELRGESCRIYIHLKNYCYPGEDTGNIYAFFNHQNRMVGIFLGELESRNGALEWQGMVDPDNVLGKGIGISLIQGIWIRRSGNRDYVADWEDDEVEIDRFVIYPKGGEKCIRCPWFGNCERSSEDASDRRGKVHEGSYPAGA